MIETIKEGIPTGTHLYKERTVSCLPDKDALSIWDERDYYYDVSGEVDFIWSLNSAEIVTNA